MSDEDTGLEGLCVLLVEDEPGLQEAFAIILELEGCEVVRANNGREALQCLVELRPDIVVTDYMMPRMNGAEMIEHLRASSELEAIPVLLLSAALPRKIGKGIADMFLPKPVSAATLLAAVRHLTAAKA